MPGLEDSLAAALKIDGAWAAAVVDTDSGQCLRMARAAAAEHLDVEQAAQMSAEAARLIRRTAESLFGGADTPEDILITRTSHYRLLRFLQSDEGGDSLFLFLLIDRAAETNMALARHKMTVIEREMTLSAREVLVWKALRARRAAEAAAQTAAASFAEATEARAKAEAVAPLPAAASPVIEPPPIPAPAAVAVAESATSDDAAADDEENLPPFMRLGSVMKLLGLAHSH